MEKNKAASYKWLILITIVSGCFMVSLDSSIVNLAITKMMTTFNATLDQIKWVLTVYTLVMGITIPASGYLSDRYGMKNVFVLSIVLFTIGSLLCGLSWNGTSIVISRIVQGIGGGLIIPIANTILMSTFDKEERGMAIGVMGIAVMAAPAIGPTLGGYIIENLDWRLIFLINIPIGIAGTILASIVLKNSEHKSTKNLDIIGFITCSIGLGCILYVLGGDNIDWGDIKNIVLMIIGCYSLIIFVANELMILEPMLDLRLLKNYTFCMSNIILNIAVLALYGGIFLVPIFMQQLKGLSPFQTGLVLFPEAIATAVSMVISGKFSNKVDTRVMAVIALILLALNSYSMSKITLNTPNNDITVLLLLRGMGVGLLIAPVQTAGFNAVLKREMPNASAIINTMKQIGASVGITIITSIMQHRNTINYADISSKINAFNPNSITLLKLIQGIFLGSGLTQADAQGAAITEVYAVVAKQAELQALNDTMFVICIISIITILPTLLLKENKGANGEVMEDS
ncbi:DHA2 family efflux MFS transporter permease subunit [Clostridium sp. JS66]|uniref:DHA2 family efflux MFS transporter permease subunit n=1 Tax=Clostridium sp. JS66 TaxID=3064705 RepID=UPI00298D73D3|nr:DHA2 family efflux MFS transporter permease subunit [Clostridium sp. JS66]WPC44058.1 DHA2 family efflux MFS transporter permease subunit [Clostridium sp. JS66]